MNAYATPGLTQPRPRSRAHLLVAVLVLVAFAVAVVVVYLNGRQPLAVVPAASTVHAVAMLIICATTAALLLTHALATGERGYLVLGGTFLYVAGVMLVFPTVYPNGIVLTDPPTVLWGTLQSSALLFHPWHLAMIVGVVASAVLLGHDQRTGRAPGLGHGLALTLGIVGVALLATVVLVVGLAPMLPDVVDGVRATPAAVVGFRIEAVLAVLGTVVVAYECRDGSMISRWLLAVMLVTVGEAVTMLNAERYSLAWYYNRLFGMVAALILLIVLIRDLGRVSRITVELIDRDRLTGAFSRPAILSALTRDVRRASRHSGTVGILWADIDGFKEVNERVGQQVGDYILIDASRRLEGVVGEQAVVGRMGGDEFAAVLTAATPDRLTGLAQQVVERLREPFHELDATVVLSASVGLALSINGQPDADTLARQASLAMRAAKEAGGDRVTWFAEDLGSDAVQRAALRHALTAALRAREFSLEYQPIVDLATGEVAGAEALVGWTRDDRRQPAGSFMAFAEESGLIVGIGRQVIDCLEATVPDILGRIPPPFVLTFNLSVKELADDGIADALVRGPLARYATRLIIEVTESFEMRAGSRAAAHLDEARAVGYRVAIDDFGAGYSNFTRLAQLRPAIIKVDRSIVVRAGAGRPDGIATLQATADVARSLDARVLAEGVESNDEAAIVMRVGVDLAQGYRYARSMPARHLVEFWAARAVGSVADLRELPRRDVDSGTA